jgi:hypothetical protein
MSVGETAPRGLQEVSEHLLRFSLCYSRRSQSFTNESNAKKFAAAELEAGVGVSAGTINPVVPKRVVAPSHIRKWLSEKAE